MHWRYEKKPRVAQQRARAEKAGRQLARGGRPLAPVVIEGRRIATSFWGRAWCDNLESYRELAYRLERGRSYVRNGAVIDLAAEAGRIRALVSGSEVYTVEVGITALAEARWSALKKRSAGQIGSLLELLEGRLSEGVMRIVTDRGEGLFPKPGEIRMSCTCLDHAGHGGLCKHIGAVLYGIGARMDAEPQLLFLLRHVDHNELITGATALTDGPATGRKTLASDELADVFGIEMAGEDEDAPAPAKPSARAGTAAAKPAARARVAAPKKSVRAAPKKRAAAKPSARKK
jgi:uncharacterized Zn finger protein